MMMKTLINALLLVILPIFLFIGCNGQKTVQQRYMSKISIYYIDSLTEKGKKIRREFKEVGEEPYFSKPTILDIELEFDSTLPTRTDLQVQVSIDELYEPTGIYAFEKTLDRTLWVPNQVVHYTNGYIIDSKQKLSLEDISYKTAYYDHNLFFLKKGFRIVVLINDQSDGYVEVLTKEFLVGD